MPTPPATLIERIHATILRRLMHARSRQRVARCTWAAEQMVAVLATAADPTVML